MSIKLPPLKRSFHNSFEFEKEPEQPTVKTQKTDPLKFEKCFLKDVPTCLTTGGDLNNLIENVNSLNLEKIISRENS